MADKLMYPVRAVDNELIIIPCTFTTNSTSNPTSFDTKHISSVTRTGSGNWTVNLAATWVSIKAVVAFPLNATTADYTVVGKASAAGSVQVELRSGGTANDGGTTTAIQLVVFAKNSSV